MRYHTARQVQTIWIWVSKYRIKTLFKIIIYINWRKISNISRNWQIVVVSSGKGQWKGRGKWVIKSPLFKIFCCLFCFLTSVFPFIFRYPAFIVRLKNVKWSYVYNNVSYAELWIKAGSNPLPSFQTRLLIKVFW